MNLIITNLLLGYLWEKQNYTEKAGSFYEKSFREA